MSETDSPSMEHNWKPREITQKRIDSILAGDGQNINQQEPQVEPAVEPVVDSAKDEENGAEEEKKKEIVEALEIYLMPSEEKKKVDGFEQKYHRAVEVMEENQIDVKTYILDRTKNERNYTDDELRHGKDVGDKKNNLMEIVHKMRDGETLNDEEKEIVQSINLQNDLAENKVQSEPVVENNAEPVVVEAEEERQEASQEERAPRTDELQKKLGYITEAEDLSILEKKKKLSVLRAKQEKSENRQRIDQVLSELQAQEEQEIQEYEARGEVRPEVKVAIEKYQKALEKRYEEAGFLVNPSMSLNENEVTKSLLEMKAIGSDGEKLANKLEKDLMSIGMLHDLRVIVNTRSAVDNDMLRYATLMKGEQFDSLLHLEDPLSQGETDRVGGKDYVVRCLVAIDEEARRSYEGTKAFKLEDPSLETKILSLAKGEKLYYLIARDLYRVTGGEARYGVAGRSHPDQDKGGSYVFDKNGDDGNGSFFRKALNIKRDVASSVVPSTNGSFVYAYGDPIIWSHLDPGVSSFWENLWSKAKKTATVEVSEKFRTQDEITMQKDREVGIPPRKYAILSVEALRSLKLGAENVTNEQVNLDNEISFNGWMDEIGKVAGAMSKETQFMRSRNFKAFQKMAEDYASVSTRLRANGEKINKDQYLLERLGDLVEYYKKSGADKTQIEKELEEYLKAGFLFGSRGDMKAFMRSHGVETNFLVREAEVRENFGRSLVSQDREQRNKSWGVLGKFFGGIFGEMFKD